MPPLNAVQYRKGSQVWTIYPADSSTRSWQAVIRIPGDRQQRIVPLAAARYTRPRRFAPTWHPDLRN
jgi:hypothetical protein